jgi:competence/damage-inducible protein CinA-like protein
MRAEIIATGSELLSGGVVDTNSVFLAEELLDIGIETAFKTIVGDDEKDMEDAVRTARERVDIILVTGGIGPTEDDITRKALARVLKKRLVLSDDALKAVKAVFKAKGKEYPGANDRQALIPAGARLLRNPIGVAPGFTVVEDGKFVAVLPGVPAEMQAMFRENLRPALEEHFGGKAVIRRKVLHTCGLSESKVNELIQDILKQKRPAVGLTARETGVDIRIVAHEGSGARSRSTMERTEADIRKKLGDAVYGVDGQEMEEVVGALLTQRKRTLAVAESCTGGLISGRFTNIAGSSAYFEQGVVAYSNAAKTGLLGVPADLIERHGAVSSEVAKAMAQGIRERSKTDVGLSVTGIAGPSGGTPEKPVGLVYIALASPDGVTVNENRFLGTRSQVRQRTAQMAMDMVRRYLIA